MLSKNVIALFLSGLVLVSLVACAPGNQLPRVSVAQQVKVLIDLGSARLMEGDFTGALVELAKAEAIDPNSAEVQTYMGMAFYGRKELDLAISRYQRAIALDPKKMDVRNNLGLVYMDQGRYEEAKKEFEACLGELTYAKPYLAIYNLGMLEEAQGHLAEAETFYKKALDLNNFFPSSYYRLATLAKGRGDTQKTVDYLLSAIRLDITYVDAYFMLAEAYESMGNMNEAAEAYGQVVVLSPNTNRAIEAQSRARRVLGYN